ncbi:MULTISPECIES: hypothetical protein [unclassified Sporosarcina]|uniref:hypothetical protein n=1 Tax=unclassified Sporosarcina TaxID=2647733 RepID=UPI00203E93E1|nr:MULTISPECIES: hypothetical protein [unclassified Sporosarcina]GKV67138.1 hypothetical protein NCCP2331_32910 [Sporosarcina sp. NCCP-2331]GLB57468.1 hypothetical protein NCCP2378_32560 [Sporosarcina sp. NCCP-2378]
MNKKKGRLVRTGILSAIFIIFVSFMTWFYPFSPFSLYKSYTYKPTEVLYNDKTYEELLNEFKETYREDLEKAYESSPEDINKMVVLTQYLLPVFEQDWLIGTDAAAINQEQLEVILHFTENSRDVLLDVTLQENYTQEQRRDLLNSIQNMFQLEDRIRYLSDSRYMSRKELAYSFDNLRGEFRDAFRFYVKPFYESAK